MGNAEEGKGRKEGRSYRGRKKRVFIFPDCLFIQRKASRIKNKTFRLYIVGLGVLFFTFNTMNTPKEDHFICPTCEKEFANYECAKELKEGGEYFCQECWDIPE